MRSRFFPLGLLAVLLPSLASAGVRGLVRNREQPASAVILRLPLTVSTADECTPVTIPGVTFSRSSSATCTKTDGTVVTLSANQPRVTAAGLLIEGAATNYFLNSGSPATQTITLSTTGSYTAWIDGTGSMAIAVGTATATGLPCTATSSSACTFSITGAGTITATITGSPTRAQVENSAIRTSYIPTEGTSAARTADVASVAQPAGLTDTAGCIGVTFGVSSAVATNTRVIAFGGINRLAVSGSTGVVVNDGTNGAAVTISSFVGRSVRAIARWSGSTLTLEADGSTGSASYDGSILSDPIYLGSTSSGSASLNGTISNVQFGRTPGACQ